QPLDLTRCGNLKSLTLASSRLSTPPRLGHLKDSLTDLSLYNNDFRHLPEGFRELKHLTHIDLGANPLADTPDLSEFKELFALRLRNCNLTQAPSIQGLSKLKHLDLSSNAIQVPP